MGAVKISKGIYEYKGYRISIVVIMNQIIVYGGKPLI